jgi:hypothetical protein
MSTVCVRWNDGYLETFNACEVRFGCDLLYFELQGKCANRHIPLRAVRWFSVDPPSRGYERKCKEVTND